MMITIKLNGETRQLQNSISVASLVDELGLTGKRVAFERNGDIVPRSQFSAQILQDGDAVEIVVAVGGG